MLPSDFDWLSGEVVYWDMGGLDATLPLTEQGDDLKEDLAQVEYPRGIVLDVGWYGPHNGFIILIVRDGDWHAPLVRHRAATLTNLAHELRAAIAKADRCARD